MPETSAENDAGDITSTFARLVRRYAEIIDGTSSDLSLCREIRSALTDLYAAAVHVSDRGIVTRGKGTIELVSETKRAEIEAALATRLPREMYWSALLPRDYLTVGDLGVKTMADDLQEIYGWLVPGSALFEGAGPTPELKDWWFCSREINWGRPTVRCMDILHEVITDLTMNLYGRSPQPS